MLTHVRAIVAALAASTVVASALVGAAPTSAVSNAITLSISPSSVAPGDSLDFIASAPVAAAGSTTQEIVQQIDPTKVKLTSLSDIQYPAGWSLSYSFNSGGSWTATAPTSATGTVTSWDKVTSVKATGNITSNGDDGNGYQVATGTSSGGATSLTPGSIPSSGAGDGYEAFFDPERTRVFNLYHHGGNNARVTDPLLDCHVIATGATCAGFPFVTNLPTGHKVTGRIVGTRLWFTTGSPYTLTGGNVFSGQPGFGCVDLSAVLASGGSPRMCSTSFVRMSAVSVPLDNFYFLGNEAAPGQTTVGVSQETRLWSMVNGKVVCLDTAAMAACSGMPANGWTVPRPIDSAGQYFSLDVIDGKIFYAGKGSTTGATKYMVGCVLASSPTTECPGWGATQVSAVTGTMAPKLLDLPDSNGNIVGVCGVSSEPWSACWTLAGAPLTKPATLPDAINGWIHPMTMGSRVYMDNNVMWCWDAALNAGAGGVCYALAPLGNANYTAVPDPAIPLCVWSSKDIANTPLNANIQTWDISVSPPRAGCGQIAPVRASFSGGAVVPRMACTSSPGAIRAWRSFTLTGVTASAGAAYTATLTVMNRNGVNIPGWVRVPITENSALSLSSLDPSVTGISPTFNVDFTTTSGTVTAASAAVQVVGDAPELCLAPTAVVNCPQALGPVSQSDLVSSSPAIVASGSVTAGGTTTQLTDDSRTLSISAPLMSQCAGTLIGRAGTATLGTSGDAIVGLTVTLLDSSGNVVLDGHGSPITTTTDSSGNYSFGDLTPANYKVRFPDTGQTATPSTAALSSVTVASGGTGTASATCPTNWTFRASDATCSRTLTATTADVGAPTGVSLTYLVVGGGGGGAASSAKPANSSLDASPSSGGDGGQVQSGTVTTTGAVGVTIGAGGAAGGNGQASTLTGGATVSATGGSAGAASSPAGAGTASSLSGTNTTYGADGSNWSGVKNTSAGGAGTANRGNGGGAGWRRYEGAGCYEPGANHVYVNRGAPCGTGGTYENGGWWNTAETAGAGGSGVVVLRYPVQLVSGAATVPAGGQAVVNALYIANPIATANTSSGKQGLTQTITPLANDTASTGATYSGGSTALKLCSTGQTAPNCTATSISVSGQGTYSVSGTTVTFTPCSASNNPVGAGCTGAFTGLATAVNYQSTDSAGQVATSTITPTVTGVPAVVSDTSTGALNTSQTISVLTNDTAGTGTTLSASTVKICTSAIVTAASCTSTTFSVAGQGTYTVNADGTVTFVPCQATGSSGATCTGPFAGTATAIKYVVSDALGQQSALATITPTVTAPAVDVANADTTTGAVGVAQTVNPLTNDTAPTGVSLKATTVKLCTGVQVAPNCTGTSLVVAGKGVYTVNATTGVLTFTPCNATSGNLTVGGVAYTVSCTGTPFTGTPTAATYQVSDNLAATARTVSSTYTPNVVPTPTVSGDTSSGALNTVQTITPLGNDAAGTGTSLDASTVKICANTTASASSCTGSSLSIAGQGTYTVNANGTVSFAPCQATGSSGASCTGPFAGTATAIKYVVSDGLGQQSALATITPTVITPSADVANPDTTSGLVGAAQSIDPLANDTSPTGVTLTPSTVKLCTGVQVAPNCTGTSLVVAGKGVYTVNATTGVLTFTPCNVTSGNLTVSGVSYAASCTGTPFAGTPTAATYQVSDNLAASARTVSSTYTPAVAAAPLAATDSSTGAVNTVQTITPLGNDTAGAGTTFVASSVKLCPSGTSNASCNATTLNVAGEGTYTVNANGTVSFAPCQATGSSGASCTGPFAGTATTIKYVVSDSLGQQTNSTISAAVTTPAVDVANADTSTGAFGSAQSVDPLANDTSPTGVTLLPTSVKLCGASQTPPGCTATSFIVAGKGVYTVNASTGELTFTPCNDVAGDLTISGVAYSAACTGTPFVGTPAAATYQVSDNLAPTARTVSATYTPTVSGPPPPSASAEVKAVLPGGTATFTTITGAGGLAHMGTVDGPAFVTSATCLFDPLTSACDADGVIAIAGEGTFTLNTSTGVVTFVAENGVTSGALTAITYQVTDSFGATATSTLTPSVPVPPTVSPDTNPGAWDVTQTISPLSNNVAASGATLVASSVKICLTGTADVACTATTLDVTGEGTYTVNADGTVSFNPLPSFTGTATAIKYGVSDSVGQKAYSTITASVSAPLTPTAAPETKPVIAGSSTTFTTLTGTGGLAQTGAGNGPAFVTSSTCLYTPGTSTCDADGVVTMSGEGTYTLNPATGVVTFAALGSLPTGSLSSITYRVVDAMGGIATSTLTPTVVAAPMAGTDATSGAQGATQTVDLTTNDAASTSATLVPSSAYLCDGGQSDAACKAAAVRTKTIAGVGTYSVSTSGVMTFTPEPSYTGTPSVLKYVISDSAGFTASSTYTPTVIPPPSATNDSTVGAQGAIQTVNLISNDTAATGATLNAASVYLCDAGESDAACKIAGAQSRSIAGVGTYTVDAAGVMTFTPEPSYTGTPAALKYVVSDSVNNVASATYTPTVIGEPTALNDASTGAWNTAQSVNPLTNENASLAGVGRFLATTVKICAVATVGPCTGTSDVTTADGVYAVSPTTGVITFTPHASFIGVVTEPLKYTATDGVGQSASAQYTPTVSAPSAPSAAAELKQVLPGSSVAFTTLTDTAGLATPGGPAFVTSSTCLLIPGTNACDPDDTITIAGEGTFTLNQGTGIVTFAAAQAASPGTKTAITYQVVDATGASARNTLTPVIPEPPSAAGDASSAGWDVTQVISPLANDAAGSGESLVLSSLKLCAAGQVPPACNASSVNVSGEGTYTVNPNGSVSFDPLPTFIGSATPLRYQVSDLLGQTASATMTPYVTPPAAPSAKDDTEVVATGGTAVFLTITGAGGLAKSGGPAFDTTKTFLCDLGQTPPNCTATSVTVTGEGTFTLNQATGVVTYVAEPTASAGPMTPMQYVVVDRIGATAHATLTPVIPPLPTAADDTSLGEAGAVQNISPLGNDSVGANTAPFVSASLKLCGPAQSPPNCDHTTLVTADGTYVVKPLTGLIEFTPDPSFTSGAATAPVQYQATDSLGRVADATITPSVLPPPAPSAAVDRKTGKFGEQLTFRPLSNDAPGVAPDPVGGVEYTDPVFDTSTLRLCDAGESPTACNATHVATADGEYDLDVATSVVTFTPHNGFTGTVTQPVTYQVSNSYTYTVSGTPNAGAQFGTSVIIPKILPPDPPSASDDDGDGSFGSPIVIDLIGNDTAGSFALDPRSIRFCAPSEQAPMCTATELITADGTWTIDLTTGVATFMPGNGFTGTARVPYVIADTYGNVVEARANAAVRAASVKPNAPANTDVVVPESPSSPATTPTKPAKKQQAPRRPLALPARIGTGTTNILALNLKTTAGRRIRVSVTCLSGANALINLGEVAASCRTSTSHGVAKVWTSGKAPAVIRVVLWAPKKKGYTAFRLVKTYRVT